MVFNETDLTAAQQREFNVLLHLKLLTSQSEKKYSPIARIPSERKARCELNILLPVYRFLVRKYTR